MCGRGGLTYAWKTVWEYLNLAGSPPDEGPGIYNLAPSARRGDKVVWTEVPVVRPTAQGRELRALVWPLIPAWLKGELPRFATANCRSEPDQPFSRTVAAKPSFRNAWRQQRRCLVPMSYFFEWDQRCSPRLPWRVFPAHAPILVLAGLWDRSPLADDQWRESFTIITSEPNRLLSEIGHHRAPVLLAPDDWEVWLGGTPEEAERLIRPPPEGSLKAHRVTRRVNNPHYQHPELVEEIAD